MLKKKVGVIDVGSNSLRLLIAWWSEGKMQEVRRELVETRLGEGLQPGSQLMPRARSRTLEALRSFLEVLLSEGVDQALVVTTSAVREASDGSSFLSEMAQKSPFPVQLLSPEEEAYWSFKGALQGLMVLPSSAGAREMWERAIYREKYFEIPGESLDDLEQWLVLDLGGRSTELAWVEDEEFKYQTFPFGAVRLHEEFYALLSAVDRERKKHEELSVLLKARVKDHMNKISGDTSAALSNWRKRGLVAVGGTVTTLTAVLHELKEYSPETVHGYSLKKREVERWEKIFLSSTLEEIRTLLPFAPRRAEIIAAGTSALLAVMEFLEKEVILVSEEGLLLGLMEKLLSKPLI